MPSASLKTTGVNALIEEAVLRIPSTSADVQASELQAGSLWANQPCLVLIIRRPGCVLCRAEAKRVWELAPQMERIGVGMACVVHEWIPREIAAFAPTYWGGPLYHDQDKAFYKALNNGQVRRGSLLSLLNPFSGFWGRVKEAQKSVPEHNVVGDGLTMGGLLVMRKGRDTGVAFMHVERDFGVHADPLAVWAAAQKAAAEAEGETVSWSA